MTTETTSPARFALDREAATAWLTLAVAASEAGEYPATDDEGRELPDICEGYQPTDDYETGGTTWTLVSSAHAAGIITGPGEVWFDFSRTSDGETGYTWVLHIEASDGHALRLASFYDDLRHCGDGGGARGIPAALAVLREAANAGNDLLADLDAYVAAQPRDRVTGECLIVDAHLTEPQFRRIGELLNTPLGRHKPSSYRYVFEPEGTGEADGACEYLRLAGVPYERQTTTRWEP